MKTVCLALFIGLFLLGCSSATLPSSPTIQASATPKLLVHQTETPKPSATPEVEVYPTDPREPTVPVATVSAMQTLDVASVTACDIGESIETSSLSPNGEWVAIVCRLDPSNNRATYTKVFRLDGTFSWKVPFYETYGQFQGIHDGTMGIYYWSKDSQFAYLIPYFCCLDVPQSDFFNYFRIAAALYRLDLNSGKVTTTLPPNLKNMIAGYAFSFSPNDKYLVYLSPGKHDEISLYTLKTGEIKKIDVADKYWLYGGFVWSADSKELAFLADSSKSPDEKVYAYFTMNISALLPGLLVEKSEIYKLNWTEENNLMLLGNDDLLFNISDHSFTVVPTATP